MRMCTHICIFTRIGESGLGKSEWVKVLISLGFSVIQDFERNFCKELKRIKRKDK